jgi:hypothetical protein
MHYHTNRDVRVVHTTHIPPQINPQITTCYCLTSLKYLAEDAVSLADIPQTTLIATIDAQLTSREQQVIQLIIKHYPHVKVALIPKGDHDLPLIIERLMYFSFDEKLRYTIITSTSVVRQTEESKSKAHKRIRKPLTAQDVYVSVISRPARFIVLVVCFIILIHTIFIVPLMVAEKSSL